jgi:hypothetical protein
MEVDTLKTFLGWCAIINFVLLAFWSGAFMIAREPIYRIHNRWFPIPSETYTVVMYCLLGGFKLLVILLNLVPWLALTFMGSGTGHVIEGTPLQPPS